MVFIAITGRPGIGKTTLVMRVVEQLRDKGVKVGGIYTTEVREGGQRIGFDVIDLMTGRRGILARIGHGAGPRIGKYTVNIDDLENLGVRAIEEAMERCDVIVVDEVGPMELKSSKFVKVVEKLLTLENKHVILTVHQRARDPIVMRVKERTGEELITLNEYNRDEMVSYVISRIAAERC